MIPKYAYDLASLAVILILVLWVKVRCDKKKKEHFNTDKAVSNPPATYRNDLRLIEGQYPDVNNELLAKYIDYYDGDGTYKRVPFKKGSRHLPYQTDEGVLKHFRVNTYLNTDSIELTYPELELLLNNIQDKGNYQVKFKSIKLVKDDKLNLDYIHDNIIKKTMELINQTYEEGNYETVFNLGDERKYKIFKKQILTDTEVEGITSDNRMVIFFLSFYKLDKDYHFTLQIKCLYNFIQNIITFKQIDIVGIHENEKIEFDKFYPIEQKYCILDRSKEADLKNGKHKNQFVYCNPQEEIQEKDLANFEEVFNNTKVRDFFKDKENERKKHSDFLKYKCFDKEGFSRSTCESYSFDKNTYGVWDKPCEKNSECPFYKANKNYPNNRGGCINGYCEMPTNVKSRGYRYYDRYPKPFCHGCKREGCIGEDCFTCCREQANNRFKYPGLKSPDFMFLNDNR